MKPEYIDNNKSLSGYLSFVPIRDTPTLKLTEAETPSFPNHQHAIWVEDQDGDVVMVYGTWDGYDWMELASYDGEVATKRYYKPGKRSLDVTLRFMWEMMTTEQKWYRKYWLPRATVEQQP